MAEGSLFGRGYNSFSGVDIKGVFNNQVIAELQAISYSVQREKAPIYTMGSADPRSFSRGKRGIAGTMIFIMFDRHVLLGTFGIDQQERSQRLYFLSDVDDIAVADAPANRDLSSLGLANAAAAGNAVQLQEGTLMTNVTSDQEPAAPWFADQIPPFDVTLAAANEYGNLAVMRIFGIELLNEGYGVSIDDMVSEMQHTYVARTLVSWRPLGRDERLDAYAAQTT
jgi:hypothetical protein